MIIPLLFKRPIFILLLVTVSLSPRIVSTTMAGDIPSGVVGGVGFAERPAISPSARTSLFRDSISNRSVSFLFLAGIATWLSTEADDDEIMVHLLDRENPLLEVGVDAGNIYGSGSTLGLITTGLLVSGYIADKPLLSESGRDLAHSLLLSGTAVWSLKLILNRQRPGGGDYSFPSGHTAAAFSAAPVLQHHFGWKIGIPAYIVAAFTGMGRMEDHKHYLSDVLFGAAIGYVAGNAVIHRNNTGSMFDHMTIDSREFSIHTLY